MSNKKIADSIIIRVGGGIREVPREPVDTAEGLESVHREHASEETENVRPFGAELGMNTKIGPDKTIN